MNPSSSILRATAVAIVSAAILSNSPVAAQQCAGDCNRDGEVVVDELVLGVNIALGAARMSMCPSFDPNIDDRVSVDELVSAVKFALDGCPINLSAKTFRSVQQIFSQSCAFSTCHSALARKGGLVLDGEDISYASLVDVESAHPEAKAMGLMRVKSSDPENSFLMRKLRAMGPGDSMPQAGGMLSEEVLEVIEDWIARGAHETTEECAALDPENGLPGLGSHAGDVETVCDTGPIEPGNFEWVPEPALAPPAKNKGIQLYVPPRDVDAGAEWETCFAFKPDWRQAAVDIGQSAGTPVIEWQEYRMHEGSHHLLVYNYFGEHTDWEWPEGHFPCSAGNCVRPGICTDGACTSGKMGKSCEKNSDCSECPPDGRQLLPIGGTQVAGTRYQVFYPEGVGIPVLNPDSVILANLHYTNPFQPAQPIYAEAWLNLYFHEPGGFKALLDGIFAIGFNDLVVQPFEDRVMSTIWRPRGLINGNTDAAVFQLFGHMHKRGVQFTIDLVKGGSCSASGDLCGKDSDCRCRPADSNCIEGQTCILGPDFEDTTIYSTTAWDNAPVVDYPKPYLWVPKEAGLRWSCRHINGIEDDPGFDVKRCHEGCDVCGWDPDTRTCKFQRGVSLGFDDELRTFAEGEPMPLAFGELADDDMCNMFGYFIPGDALDRLP